MKYSLNWIKEFVDVPCSDHELAEKLSLIGLEVEGFEQIAHRLKGIVTGKITAISKHPDADKLQITQIFDGQNTHQIVTGAQNVFVGAVVPVSLPGAVLANGTEIKHGNLRGVESNGMLCSETELGSQETSEGIWILPEDTPLGIDFVQYANLQDTLLDLNILPNRGDCQSMIGIAREIAAAFNTPLNIKTPALNITAKPDITIQVTEPDLCPNYTARRLTNITQASTPLWMQQRLKRCGIRPINLSVDITNYVMLESGQPLHAFDSSTFDNQPITIRSAQDQETMVSLDQSTLQLKSSQLVIANSAGPVAVAGVIGGLNSGVNTDTTSIILEAAYFHPNSVRKTRSDLSARTESAIRFEKGVDPASVEYASNRAAELFQQLANAECGTINSYKNEQSPVFSAYAIPFNAEQLNRFLGSNWSEKAMTDCLENLGFKISGNQASVPTWRQHDCKEWPCLAEEIARSLGFSDIPEQLPQLAVPISLPTPIQALSQQIESLLLGLGFQQLNTFPMTSPTDFEKTGSVINDTVFELQNPLTPEQSVMRQDLLQVHLGRHQFNLAHQQEAFNSFEIGKCYQQINDTVTEHQQLAILMTRSHFQNVYTHQEKESQKLGFAELKGIAEVILEKNRSIQVSFQPLQDSRFHPVQSAAIFTGKTQVGCIGFLHPKILHSYDITSPMAFISLNVSLLSQQPQQRIKSQTITKFPAVKRDLALLIPNSLSYNDLVAAIKKQKIGLLKSIDLFDLYESDKLGPDHKSIALRLTYQHQEKTLTDDDVSQVHQALCTHLTTTLPVSIR